MGGGYLTQPFYHMAPRQTMPYSTSDFGLKLADEAAAFSASPSHGNEKCRFWPEYEEGFVEGGEFGFLAACDYPKIRSRNIIWIISTTDFLNLKS